MKVKQNTTVKKKWISTALIEVLNIKIIEKLREEMSGIYGGGIGRHYFEKTLCSLHHHCRLPCGPENVEKLTNAFFKIIKKVQEKGVIKKTWTK